MEQSIDFLQKRREKQLNNSPILQINDLY